jgi:hypothetical protein
MEPDRPPDPYCDSPMAIKAAKFPKHPDECKDETRWLIAYGRLAVAGRPDA